MESLWKEEDFQYRLTLEATVSKPGWQEVVIPENLPIEEASRLSGFPIRPESFSFNRVRLFEVTPQGEKHLPDAGYYLLSNGKELVPEELKFPVGEGNGEGASEKNGMLQHLLKSQHGKQVAVPVEAGKLYLCRFSNSGGGSSPTYLYEPIHEEGSRLRKYNYRISYVPRLLKKELSEYKVLVQPDADGKMLLFYTGTFMGKLHSLSFAETRIALMVHFDKPGTRRFRLYYQPVNAGVFLSVPEKQMEGSSCAGKTDGKLLSSEKQSASSAGRLVRSGVMEVFGVLPTEKLTPSSSLPDHEIPCVNLSAARNEKESFQLVIVPKRNFRLLGVETTLHSTAYTFPESSVEVKRVRYVPIRSANRTSPWRFQGLIGDPLVKFQEEAVKTDQGNLPLWFTVTIGKDTPPGMYKGNITLKTDRAGKISVPISLKVHSFTLPEYSSLVTNLGLQYFTKGSGPIAQYHGAKTSAEVKKLSDLYFEEMAKNRLSPKNFALYTPLTFQWDPPPKGMNVEAKDNFFRLYNWDFTEYNKQLDTFIGKLKMNQICIYHTNPTGCNLFLQLPGKELKEGFNTSSPFVTMHNQSFREMILVGYGLTPKHSYSKIARQITRDQFDRLVLDYLRAIAENLEKKGYLGYATILIDESENDQFLKHFLSLLKNDPLLKKIKVGGCIQGMGYYTKKEPSGEYAFRNLLDVYIPEIDDTYDRLEPYYRTDYSIPEDRSKFMPYIAYSSRITTDAPGITNRIVGFDIFHRGGSGLLDWEILAWHMGNREGRSRSPWTEPLGYCNGGTAYFYPPLTDGYPAEPDYTVTPSLRLELLREAVDDFDYAYLLEKTVEKAKARKIDCSGAEKLFREIDGLFDNAVTWSLNDQQLNRLRERIAEEIETLNRKMEK